MRWQVHRGCSDPKGPKGVRAIPLKFILVLRLKNDILKRPQKRHFREGAYQRTLYVFFVIYNKLDYRTGMSATSGRNIFSKFGKYENMLSLVIWSNFGIYI